MQERLQTIIFQMSLTRLIEAACIHLKGPAVRGQWSQMTDVRNARAPQDNHVTGSGT